jgi:hypothetical protein
MDRVRKVPLVPNAGLKVIARSTPGFLGAEQRTRAMTVAGCALTADIAQLRLGDLRRRTIILA